MVLRLGGFGSGVLGGRVSLFFWFSVSISVGLCSLCERLVWVIFIICLVCSVLESLWVSLNSVCEWVLCLVEIVVW